MMRPDACAGYGTHARRGFGASVAVLTLALGTAALVLVVREAVMSYAVAVEKRQERVQKRLDDRACSDAVAFIRAKDVFASGRIEIPDLGCVVSL